MRQRDERARGTTPGSSPLPSPLPSPPKSVCVFPAPVCPAVVFHNRDSSREREVEGREREVERRKQKKKEGEVAAVAAVEIEATEEKKKTQALLSPYAMIDADFPSSTPSTTSVTAS